MDESRIRPTDITLQIPSSEKFRNKTGWKPTRGLDDICEDLLEYWRSIVMFICVVEVNNKKIRLIFPHKCGSRTFSNLIRSGYFDVPLISTNDMDSPEEIHVYGRNPYRKMQYQVSFK